MKYARLLKSLFAIGMAAACICALAACSGQGNASSAVAASGNGISIAEDEVTQIIQSNRTAYSMEDEDSWGQALVDADMTPESYREQVINSLVDEQLLKNGAESLGVTVDSSEIDSHVDSIKAQLGIENDEGWAEALQRAGFTEEEYRENINDQLVQQAVTKHFQDETELSDDDLLEEAQDYVSYYDGAKRSSHILIGVDDTSDEAAMKEAREKAQDLLDQINDGADFAELAKENSTDTGSAEKGGDVGWDVLSSFVTEYTDALADLDEGEVSGLVESQYGIHIIKVTEVFTAPKKLKKVSDLPEAFQETITNMAKQTKSSEAYDKWLEEQREAAAVTINPMPADVPYNVDLSKYKTEDEDASEGGASSEDSEAATADGDESTEVVEVEEEGEGSENAEEVEVELEETSSDAAASSGAASSESSSSGAASDKAA